MQSACRGGVGASSRSSIEISFDYGHLEGRGGNGGQGVRGSLTTRVSERPGHEHPCPISTPPDPGERAARRHGSYRSAAVTDGEGRSRPPFAWVPAPSRVSWMIRTSWSSSARRWAPVLATHVLVGFPGGQSPRPGLEERRPYPWVVITKLAGRDPLFFLGRLVEVPWHDVAGGGVPPTALERTVLCVESNEHFRSRSWLVVVCDEAGPMRTTVGRAVLSGSAGSIPDAGRELRAKRSELGQPQLVGLYCAP